MKKESIAINAMQDQIGCPDTLFHVIFSLISSSLDESSTILQFMSPPDEKESENLYGPHRILAKNFLVMGSS